MTKEAPENQSYTSGFYNSKSWPIQLVVSRYNVTLYLPPGEFIRDKQKRKINDPFFEVYVKGGTLARETTDKPVPILTVPVATAAVGPVNDGQSVRSVTEFTTDAKGLKQPVIPMPKPSSEQSLNKPAFVGMSMDEAKKMGLIKKVREVPEDYGVPDNNSAAPPRTPPPLKIAVDTDQPARPTAPLVQTNVPPPPVAMPVARTAARKQLQDQLRKGADETAALDTETGFMNVAMNNIPPGVGLAQPEISAPVHEPIMESDVLPAPDIDGDESLPAPPEEADSEESASVPQPTVKPARVPIRSNKYACMECGQTFKLRPELAGHAKREHPEQVAAVLAPYPQ